MRRRWAVAWVVAAVLLGSGTGAALGSVAPHRGAAPLPYVSATASGSPTASGPPGPVLSAADLLQPRDLATAGWADGTITAAVRTDEADPTVSPCQTAGPFSGLTAVVVGRWAGGGSHAGEVAAQAPTVDEARRRAEDLYSQHLRCAELSGRTVGPRHAVSVDGGSVTWFAVTDGRTEGFSSVLRQSNRFAVVYLDRSRVGAAELTQLLQTASAELR